ncbi:hypothetical protein HIM_02356 [Hirsutella minnesotensis 3608]|nr:hypothetical protein HIM_02356 [Hirsutella minnesotensis 3608]
MAFTPESEMQKGTANTPRPGAPQNQEFASDSDSDESTSSDDDEGSRSNTLRSPTGLLYNLDDVLESKRAIIRDALVEPPDIALQHCRRIDDTYAFQMSETVTRSIRICPANAASPSLKCSCGGVEGNCKHLVWLLDQLTKQTLYGHDFKQPLTMGAKGYATEIGDPFQTIAQHHLDVLAEGLHCQPMPSTTYSGEQPLDAYRILESREMLSSIFGMDPDEYRPNFRPSVAQHENVLRRHDLDHTILSMLIDNSIFFNYFLTVSQPTDPIKDPFRKLKQRADRVLSKLDAHVLNKTQSATDSLAPNPLETPPDVSWAARHLVGIVKLIRAAIYTRKRPLRPREALSAARTLIHVLDAVVSRNRDVHAGQSRRNRNLYLRLVGDQDQSFVIAELDLIPEASSHFLHSLEVIDGRIGIYGAPSSYVDKLRRLLSRLRTSAIGAGLKRNEVAQASHHDTKRMK